MHQKVYHKRGMEPRRKIICSVDGRLHPEQADTIVKLYMLDKLTIADISRLYQTHWKNIKNLLDRESKRRTYSEALRQLDEDRDKSYSEIAEDTGLTSAIVKKIALRNGLCRKER